MIALQLISLIFALYMLYWSFLVYKKKLVHLSELIFWTLVWTTFIGITFFPNTVKFAVQTFRINRVMDLLMIISFIILWFISFKNYVENKQCKKKLQELVEQVAIDKAIKKNSKK